MFASIVLFGYRLCSFYIQQDLKELKEDVKRQVNRNMFEKLSSSKNMYKESTNSDFPTIGSRVRRGPDWKWQQQDGEGPGTIIGHDGQCSHTLRKYSEISAASVLIHIC